MNRWSTVARLIVLVSFLVTLSASQGWTDTSVYVRFGDGRIVRAPHHVAVGYVQQGGVIIGTLPTEYVAQPYGYYQRYPVYYSGDYWHQHHRHWRDESRWQREHEHSEHEHHDQH
jgi:hypothetical protein